MVAPLESSMNASAYPKRQHLTKTGADALYISVAAGVISGAAAPVSGGAGSPKGQLYLETTSVPNIPYLNVGDALVSSWVSLLTGNIV